MIERSDRRIVRPEWLQAVMNACQAMADAATANVDRLLETVRSAAVRIPIPALPLEGIIFRGLLAEIMLRQLAGQGTIPAECVRVLVDATKPDRGHADARLDDADHPKVLLALAFIAASFRQPNLRLRKVADAVHLSPWYLSRLLHERLGMGFGNYVREMRLVHASVLLRPSTRSIKEISAEVGYKYPRDFSHDFRKWFGVTPSAWRRLKRHRES